MVFQHLQAHCVYGTGTSYNRAERKKDRVISPPHDGNNLGPCARNFRITEVFHSQGHDHSHRSHPRASTSKSSAFSHRGASCKLGKRPLTVRANRKRRELIRPPRMVSSSVEASWLLNTCWAVRVRRKSTEE